MAWLDTVNADLNGMAAKIGLTPDQVQAITATLKSKLAGGTDQITALTETAAQHGVPVDKIKDMLAAAGENEGLLEKAENYIKGLFSKV